MSCEKIHKLLDRIASQPGVVGSVVIGHDGTLIAHNLPKNLDPHSISNLSQAIYTNATNTIRKPAMSHNQLHELIFRTEKGYFVIADFGTGILVAITDGQGTEHLIPLMRSITQLIAH